MVLIPVVESSRLSIPFCHLFIHAQKYLLSLYISSQVGPLAHFNEVLLLLPHPVRSRWSTSAAA